MALIQLQLFSGCKLIQVRISQPNCITVSPIHSHQITIEFPSQSSHPHHPPYPMTDPWCWYINANMTRVYGWDPWHTIYSIYIYSIYIYSIHGSYGYPFKSSFFLLQTGAPVTEVIFGHGFGQPQRHGASLQARH